MGTHGGNSTHGEPIVSATAETQERWRRYYEEAAVKSGDRDVAGALIQKAQKRVIWQTVFMVGSTVFLGGLFTVFYNVLSR
jgi:hypothetical protein